MQAAPSVSREPLARQESDPCKATRPKRLREAAPEAALGASALPALPKGLDAKYVGLADRVVARRLFDPELPIQPVGRTATRVANDVYSMLVPRQEIRDDNHAVLLLGESGSGKTTVVEHCIRQLRAACPTAIVLRAYGGAYASDLECLHHLILQLGHRMAAPLGTRASFEESMHLAVDVFRASFEKASAVVVVLDGLEHFCSRSRQSLLYSLFDEAQNVGVNLTVVGTSVKLAVMDSFEKRIWSRFEMRHMLLHLPTVMEDLVLILMERFRLPKDCGLPETAAAAINAATEAAIRSQEKRWLPHLANRHPQWFLLQCGGLWGLLAGEAATEAVAPKRPRLAAAPAPEERLVESLTECEHVVMLAIRRLMSRRVPATMASVCQEIKHLDKTAGSLTDVHLFVEDAFLRLANMRLVALASGRESPHSAPKHLLCRSVVEHIYSRHVEDLRQPYSAQRARNPLRDLPTAVQEFACLKQVQVHRP